MRASVVPSLLASLLLQAALLAAPARAQHADAGVERQAAPPPAPAPPAEPPAEHTPPEGVSTLKRIPNPAQLSESVRARLEQRAALHAADLAQGDQGVAPPVTQPAAPVPGAPADDAPLRRGEALQRRVQAVDTEEGVTVLSNRLVLPDSRLTLTAARSVAEEPEPETEAPVEEAESAALDQPARVTETHSLRTLGSRPAKANPANTGLGWLVWPFVLFVLGGAVVGTLWFRKKTE